MDDSVSVTDTFVGTLPKVTYKDVSPTTFTYSHQVPVPEASATPICEEYDNTATFTTDTTGTQGSASQSVKACGPYLDLTASKTANPAFTRTYTWGISKSVDKTIITTTDSTATFNYTVNVTHNGGIDSGWVVTGTITITNPNSVAVAGVNVVDSLPTAANCTISVATTNQTIAAYSSLQLPYTCTFVANPGSGTNTANVSWDPNFISVNHSTSPSADFKFGEPTTLVDDSVSITDTFAGTPFTLGIVSYKDASPRTFTYPRIVAVPPAAPQTQCYTYNNTATFMTDTTGTQGSASQSVKACGPHTVTGALTMGFWQNKNGQSIITNGASTAGVCNSGTWLRNYAPFQDLSTTANCSDVGGYVYKVIKAANASGATMNAMLKAQMLATALDVYFSDPALGGNKINAPTPIGGLTVDLTKICAMIDSSSGANCSGSYENVSSAFSGHSIWTVSDLLNYAAGLSISDGAIWYGNVKATQQLAKDTFDAINNQVAHVI